jgi:murein DD-endopeptidase MepM/ murein hydrolase activator NlpD
MSTYSDYNFAKVMGYPDSRDELFIFDFAKGYDVEFIRSKEWGIGKYNEKRSNMYLESMFDNERNVHMGIDIWTESGAPVFSFWDGEVAYIQNNDQPGDYGPTIVVKYELDDSTLYALFGHLSKESLEMVSVGKGVKKGQQIATLGSHDVNGGWAPHLHFQLSKEDPQEADMPGVVALENRGQALDRYPDPRLVLGDLY